jgi:quercetin dioxygenase-like cupin family protein
MKPRSGERSFALPISNQSKVKVLFTKIGWRKIVGYNYLTRASVLLVALVAGAASVLAEPNEKQFFTVAPEQLKWAPLGDGVEFAKIYGDPTKAGAFYVIQVKFPPYTFDYPHYHPEDRHITVVKGTWYAGTGEALDVDKAIALKPGSYMFHPGKAVHWDGAKDEEVIVEIAGIGPGPTILAKPGGNVFFSIKN